MRMTGATGQARTLLGNPPQTPARNSHGHLLTRARWSRATVLGGGPAKSNPRHPLRGSPFSRGPPTGSCGSSTGALMRALP